MAADRQQQIKLFTVEEANRTLPLVRSIVRDVVERYQSLREALSELSERPGSQELQDRIENLKADLMQNVEELGELGAELKSFELGLVDFYHKKDDRIVYLCWKLGEDRISWWHELEAGYAGRRPL